MTVRIEPLTVPKLSALVAPLPGEELTSRGASALDFCQKMSNEMYAGYVDDTLVCCWGLIPPTVLSNQAYLWMWTNNRVKEHSFLLVRHSQKQVSRMLDKYETIIGHCRLDRPDSQRWLRWLGAEFEPPYGAFRPFVIRRK